MANKPIMFLLFIFLGISGCASVPDRDGEGPAGGGAPSNSGGDDTLEEVLKDTGFMPGDEPVVAAKLDQKELEKALSRMLGDLKEQADELAKNSESLKLDKDGRYTIRRGDSLSEILEKIAQGSNINPNLLKRAFVAANPRAFKRSNPNWMYANAKLRFPEEEDFKKILFRNAKQQDSKKETEEDPYSGWIRFPAR